MNISSTTFSIDRQLSYHHFLLSAQRLYKLGLLLDSRELPSNEYYMILPIKNARWNWACLDHLQNTSITSAYYEKEFNNCITNWANKTSFNNVSEAVAIDLIKTLLSLEPHLSETNASDVMNAIFFIATPAPICELFTFYKLSSATNGELWYHTLTAVGSEPTAFVKPPSLTFLNRRNHTNKRTGISTSGVYQMSDILTTISVNTNCYKDKNMKDTCRQQEQLDLIGIVSYIYHFFTSSFTNTLSLINESTETFDPRKSLPFIDELPFSFISFIDNPVNQAKLPALGGLPAPFTSDYHIFTLMNSLIIIYLLYCFDLVYYKARDFMCSQLKAEKQFVILDHDSAQFSLLSANGTSQILSRVQITEIIKWFSKNTDKYNVESKLNYMIKCLCRPKDI